ncbi:YceI family protein [Aquimarina sp. ERC-38]|uniref:YceI family protein n=1 Tax=Aquimarina sp. ERC-38 TaxID=2949996 RepID=UPI0022453C3A|nr:YceI family protein [Aquimarina sp. ERC-38]UZO81547.1 YceI family protein [Aquimarina sp. ERC-38]
MKITKILLLFLLIGSSTFGQKYLTQTGTIQFFSETPLENIEAVNTQVSSVLNAENGEMAFSLLLKAFLFEKALMQEHFNEKYVESDKFPKSQFKGKIENFDISKLTTEPKEFTVKGRLTIHGKTNDIVIKKKLSTTENGEILGASTFTINLEDYDVKIPAAVRKNISESIKITVKVTYEKFG